MGEEEEDNDENGGIDNELGAPSEENNDDEPVRKKAKTVKKKLELDSVEEASTQPKGKRKSAGVELAQEMRCWHEHREKEYVQRELSKLSFETHVMRKLKEVYADDIDKFNFQEYTRLVLLLCTKNEDFAGCNGAKYFTMMEEGDPKFRDKLMEQWFQMIKD